MFKNTHLFQETANFFKLNGRYTNLIPGSKAYKDFWTEERRRCKYGYEVEGVKITGYHYNYLNFSPILKAQAVSSEVKEDENALVQAERVLGFPDFWDGDYKFFWYIEDAEKNGEHGILGGSRGKGKSLKSASMCVRNYHHFKKSKSYCFAAKEEYLLKDGIISKAWELMDFVDAHTPWGKRRHENNSELHRKSSTKIKNEFGIDTVHPKSFNSEIIGVTTGDSIGKLRGKRGKLIILEEGGLYPNLNKGWGMLRPSMEDGQLVFGLILAIGTGGEEGANFEGFEELFLNPKAYNIRSVKNEWDEGMVDTECGFFFPVDQNFSGAMDKDGNSDREKARRIIEASRKLTAQGNDPHALTRKKAELPLNPREMMMRISGTQFPIDELKKQEAEIVSKPHQYKEADFIGKFHLDKETQKYKFEYDPTVRPLYDRNVKDNKNLYGGIVLYSHPAKDGNGEVFENRYVAGIDSYDFDESTTTSLGSCFIGDLWTRRIVAEYTGRPKTSEEFYENVRRLLLYFNAKANVENANKGIFDYMDNKNCGWLLMDEPRIVRETLEDTTVRNNTGRRRRGTPPSKEINKFARGLLAKWCTESTNNPDKPEEIQLHRFRCLPAIKEMVVWTIDGNFDRVSALSMLMLALHEREKYNEESVKNHKSLAQDDFFKRNYRRLGK
jgi:hypothetical protein